MKYVIEINWLDKFPDDMYSCAGYDSSGIYMCKGTTSPAYFVSKENSLVTYIGYPDVLMKTPFKDTGDAVSESLLLKAIAAAASRQLAV